MMDQHKKQLPPCKKVMAAVFVLSRGSHHNFNKIFGLIPHDFKALI